MLCSFVCKADPTGKFQMILAVTHVAGFVKNSFARITGCKIKYQPYVYKQKGCRVGMPHANVVSKWSLRWRPSYVLERQSRP